LIHQTPLCPSNNEKHGARAMTLDEIHTLKNAFVHAAIRAQKSGYHGVEVHGAHGYILTQFLSSEINTRTDQYGGSLENRSRLLFEIVDEIRNTCGSNFLLGVRLSPERFGMDLMEVKEVCTRLIDEAQIDFLDISLWDVFKSPHQEAYNHLSLLSHFTKLDLKKILLTVAGKIQNADDVKKVLAAGVDFVTIGRSGILHHDFPQKVINDPKFEPISTPVSTEYLETEGLGPKFIQYMKRWADFVAE
jgi:2,4-dienoyl-CoA reductase-like NADH-dependent reductase (Old Yellow Enzyme family)